MHLLLWLGHLQATHGNTNGNSSALPNLIYILAGKFSFQDISQYMFVVIALVMDQCYAIVVQTILVTITLAGTTRTS